jgi:hypothetical protein
MTATPYLVLSCMYYSVCIDPKNKTTKKKFLFDYEISLNSTRKRDILNLQNGSKLQALGIERHHQ